MKYTVSLAADQMSALFFFFACLFHFFSSIFQIVRTDLKELRDLDLEGAPYGYTPFCESRKEMDGYRFWKSGYWASHLGPRKYHIRSGGGALWATDDDRGQNVHACILI